MNIKFVKYDENYLNKSWEWLNDEEIKKLTMTSKFTRESQIQWFETLSRRNDYLINGIAYDNIPIGVIGIKNIDFNKCCGEYFGYIGEKDYWSRGIGKLMLLYAKDLAKIYHLDTLYLNVSKDNKRAYNLYKRFGFYEVGVNKDVINMRLSIGKNQHT